MQKRQVLEEAELLDTRISALEEDLDEVESSEEEDEEEERVLSLALKALGRFTCCAFCICWAINFTCQVVPEFGRFMCVVCTELCVIIDFFRRSTLSGCGETFGCAVKS